MIGSPLADLRQAESAQAFIWHDTKFLRDDYHLFYGMAARAGAEADYRRLYDGQAQPRASGRQADSRSPCLYLARRR